MRKKLFLLFALLCLAVSGAWADEVSFNTTQKKYDYENDYVKVRCNDADFSYGMALGGALYRYIWIESKHNTKITKIVFTVTYTQTIEDLVVWGGSFTRNGKTITVTPNSDNDTGNVTLYSENTQYYLFVDHVDVTYVPTELASNANGVYPISSKADWELFCSTVNDGKSTYSGKKVILMNDIGDITNPVTTMVGDATGDGHVFSGTFDGQGHKLTVNLESTENRCSPFRVVKGGTIQNLRVEGTIKCTSYSGGIIGATYEAVTLKNCNSAVNLTNRNYNGNDIGGLIGCVNSSSSLNIEGCIFSGKMSLGQTDIGGMVGYVYDNSNENKKINFTNCLVALSPTDLDIGYLSTTSTFCYIDKPDKTANCSFNNCYYLSAIGNAQGKAAHTIAAVPSNYSEVEGLSVTMENVGTPATEYTVSGITAYTTGIKYNGLFYAGKDDEVSLKLTPTAGYAISGIQQGPNISESGADNLYTLTMTDNYEVIRVILAQGYKVSSTDLVSGETELVQFTTDKAIYSFGETVTLTATLASNVVLNSVTLIPEADPTLTKTATKTSDPGNQYQFPMPTSNVIVTYDYYVNKGQNAFNITWDGGTGVKMSKQVGGINVLNANAGDEVTITLSEESNKLATNVTVTRVGTNTSVNVTRESVQENVFTFTMPSESVTVAADFKSPIFMMTADHCTIEASVNGGTATVVNDLVGVIGAKKNDKVTLTVTPTVSGEVISQTALAYTPKGGESVSTYATKVDATHFEFTMPDDVTVTVYPLTAYALADGADNSSTLSTYNGKFCDVMLQGRTLYKDGDWNTLCLPFDLKAIDFDTNLGNKGVGDTHPFDGAIVKMLDNTGFNAGTLSLNFKTPVADTESGVVIPAGTPFLIKWDKAEGYDNADPATRDLVDPVICDVTINNTTSDATFKIGTSAQGAFKGTYSPIAYTATNKSILFLGSNNTLYYPQPKLTYPNEEYNADTNPYIPVNIGAFRAYFQLDGITVEGSSAGVRQFVLNFGDDGTQTVIGHTDFTDSTDEAGAWFSLDGMKMQGRPTKKGLYINNGRKVVIK